MSVRSFIKSSTFRLAASYLAIIMTLSIAFSGVFYATSARELDKKPDPDYYRGVYNVVPDHELDEWLRDRAETGRGSLAVNLLVLNMIALVLGGAFSYFLARKTLQPIEAAMQAQDRFIADASHELRTPLTSLLLNNEVALRKKNLTAEVAKETIGQNIRDLEQLRSLSDNLLDLAVNETDGVTKKIVPLAIVVDAAISQVAPMADARGITLRGDVGSYTVTTNQQLLTKLLVILCDNAIKYSDDATSVRITASLDERYVVLRVSDEGYGMKKSDVDRIFDRFYRADQSRSSVMGHGLGLSIAAKIVRELGGSITVKSTLGKGSVFSISLPV